jgi:hypothetical protein
MQVISFPESAITRKVSIDAYRPTPEELKLLNWAVTHKAFGPNVRRAIQDFILRKEGSKLDILTITEMNSLKINARGLGVSLQR